MRVKGYYESLVKIGSNKSGQVKINSYGNSQEYKRETCHNVGRPKFRYKYEFDYWKRSVLSQHYYWKNRKKDGHSESIKTEATTLVYWKIRIST
jgi:hypothetical protein